MSELQKRLEYLRTELQRHDHLYYIEARPEISDRDYDALYAELREIEKDHPELVTDDSPTKRVAGAPLSEFTTVKHDVPMLSLDNTYNRADLQRFHEYVLKGLNFEKPIYTIEPKVDGVSIALRYENGILVRALTRGNGKQGDDVTQNIRTIPSVPLRLRTIGTPPAVFEARGEVFMSRLGFSRMNERRRAAGEEEFANARNATAGSLKQLDSRIVANRPLDIVFYTFGTIDGLDIASQRQLLETFSLLGLKTQKWLRTATNFEEIIQAIDELNLARRDFPYDTDGAVIKVDSFTQRERLGMTAHAPSWAKAYKFEPEQARTLLKSITIQVGRTGVLTPVAELEPVFLSGSTIARATLHNEDDIARKDIRIGDTVIIEKAGEVIPAVVGFVPERRPADSTPFDFSGALNGQCPSCGSPIVRDPKFAAWRCENLQCPAQNVRRIEYFAARNALDIESLGGIVAEALVDSGYVNEPLDLFNLNLDQLANLNLGTENEPRLFGAKNGQKLLDALERSRTLPLANWLQALGIPDVGAATAYHIGRTHKDLSDVAQSSALKALLALVNYQETGRIPEEMYLDIPCEDSEQQNDAALGELFACMAAQKNQTNGTRKMTPGEVIKSWTDLLLPLDLIKQSASKSKNKKYITTSIGPKTAQSVLDFFSSSTGQAILARLLELGISPQGGASGLPEPDESSATASEASLPLRGMTFVITGTLLTMDRDTAFAKIRAAGGATGTSVSKNTTYLVAGANTGARKTEKAAELGVKVINEEEFLALLNPSQETAP